MKNKIERVAIVTGGGRGLGQRRRAGWRWRILRSRCRAAAEPLGDSPGYACAGREGLAIPADLVDPAAPQHIVQTTVQAWGRLDVLVNARCHPPSAIG
jgi:NAD(P)-dependent dehydrogenase (short-subunit alcohol dehydrogenase family)